MSLSLRRSTIKDSAVPSSKVPKSPNEALARGGGEIVCTGLLVRGLKPDGSLDCTAATATLPASKHPAANAITGFDAAGAPICTAITAVYGAAVPTTLYLELPGCGSHLTTNTTCWALMCSPANGVFPLRNCTNGKCMSNINNAFVNCDTTKVGVLVVGP